MTASNPIVIDPPTAGGRKIWRRVLSLADELGPDREWTLVGGLMVQLHAFEHGDEPRPTADIDLLGGRNGRPG